MMFGLVIRTPGCAYLSDRKKDALDIFTVQVGYGGGFKARAGPVQTGLLIDVGLAGLRGGEFVGIKDFWPAGYDTPSKVDIEGIFFGAEGFSGNENSGQRGKSFAAVQKGLSKPSPIRGPTDHDKDLPLNPWAYYTNVEFVAGFILNMRVGINFGELADFIVGWVGVDAFKDDMSTKKKKSVRAASRGWRMTAAANH